jgi:hypothetical protein
MSRVRRSLIPALNPASGEAVVILGWVYRLRVLAKTTFIIVKDCTGEGQCVAATESLRDLRLSSTTLLRFMESRRASCHELAPHGILLARSGNGFHRRTRRRDRLERELLSFIFGKLNELYASMLARYRLTPLPSLERVPI